MTATRKLSHHYSVCRLLIDHPSYRRFIESQDEIDDNGYALNQLQRTDQCNRIRQIFPNVNWHDSVEERLWLEYLSQANEPIF